MEPQSPRNSLRSKYKPFANFLTEEKMLNTNIWFNVYGHQETGPDGKQIFDIHMFSNHKEDIILHWGIGIKNPTDWEIPPNSIWPLNTTEKPGVVQTTFTTDSDFKDLKSIKMRLPVESLKIRGITYAICEPKTNIWYNNMGSNHNLRFPMFVPEIANQNEIPDFAKNMLECEGGNCSWSLMHRYNKCGCMINDIPIENEDYLAWVFICLKFSSMKLITWQRSFNTPPKDLTGAQNYLGRSIIEKWVYLRDKKDDSATERFLRSQDLLRQMLGLVGKGAINGQEIRDEILRIFHKYLIPERTEHFYEQWHQKLHNNTNSDDIVICEALLAYLKSNDMGQYWKKIYEGGLSKEKLLEYERKITMEPYYAPQYIGDFENLLVILKKAHSATDLLMLAEHVNNRMNPGLNWGMWEVMNNLNDWDTIKQLDRTIGFRFALSGFINGVYDRDFLKDLLYLDLGLEYYQRQLVERIIHIDVGFENNFKQIFILIGSLLISYKWKELQICKEELESKINETKICDKNYMAALKVKAVLDRLKRCLGEVIERCHSLFQFKAEQFGNVCKCNPATVSIFSEEVVRGSLFFALSMVLKKIDPVLRKALGSQPWLIISPIQKSSGKVVFVKQLKKYEEKEKEPVIVITEQVGGEEEVPPGVVAVILVKSVSYPDVLAHVSVRARNNKVLLAACLESEGPIVSKVMEIINGYASIEIKGNSLEIKKLDKLESTETSPKTSESKSKPELIMPQSEIKEYVLQAKDFERTKVGAKSNNLNKIRGKIEDWILLPNSIALQFGSIEDILNAESNEKIRNELDDTLKSVLAEKSSNIPTISRLLEKCKKLIMSLEFPTGPKGELLAKSLEEFGIPKNEIHTKAWNSIKKVYASKYNERAFIATNKIGVSLENIRMAVLVQKVVTAEYAFVVHTKNPTNNSENEIYVEAVKGLGETLVGSYAGQAFSFTLNKKNLAEPAKVNTFFNKSIGISTKGGWMFRSDSNTEDLEGFAGAGLFDSYPSEPAEHFRINYSGDKLINDEGFRNYFMSQIGKIGKSIESVYGGSPQDIEGCYVDGKFYVVQTRPQV